MRRDPGDGVLLTDASGLVEHFFRHEYGRLVAILTRKVGIQHVDLVEDAVQTALMTALTSWVAKGLPDDPRSWLYRVAHNQLIGTLRNTAGRLRILEAAGNALRVAPNDPVSPRFDGEVRDDLLRMLFVCCNEAIPRDSRLVLALKMLCGFSTTEIALRLFLSEANVLKRLGRAREHLREIPSDFNSLPLDALQSRLASVQVVLYLLFNEGYLSAQSDTTIRREMCDEAIRLATLLTEHPVGTTPETFALLALMHFHGARLNARLDGIGGLLLLEEQDRSLCYQDQVRLGAECLKKAATGESFTRFHAEAGIAAEHVFAPSFAETRWKEIADLYSMLDRIAPSPLNALNRAVAVSEWQGPEAGVAILNGIERPSWLLGYYLWDAVLGELHRRAGHNEEARRYIEQALASAPTDAERELLRRRLASINH
ncbi:MAG: RNA polymerase subunit sigma-70 [Acidobacteria bacterium]|nr:MAG: RNA polymerase subunit sigma-70 [Acidobacteriota bacterium]